MHVVLAQDRVRAIGVCYGHQIIARAMGTKVGRSDKGWEASVTEVKMTQKGKELFEKDILVKFMIIDASTILTSLRAYIRCTKISSTRILLELSILGHPHDVKCKVCTLRGT